MVERATYRGASRVLAAAGFWVACCASGCGSHQDSIVGCWDWGGGTVVEVNADGTVQHDSGDTGTWTQDADGTYVFTWVDGWVDGITLENGILVEHHLAWPSGATPSDFTAAPTSCANYGSGHSSSGSHCGASGTSCVSSSDCCGTCEMDESSSFYHTCS